MHLNKKPRPQCVNTSLGSEHRPAPNFDEAYISEKDVIILLQVLRVHFVQLSKPTYILRGRVYGSRHLMECVLESRSTNSAPYDKGYR